VTPSTRSCPRCTATSAIGHQRKFVVEAPGLVDRLARVIKAHLDHDLMLQMPPVAVPERGGPTPVRRSDLFVGNDHAGLLAQFPYRCVPVGLALVDAASGQFPPLAEFRRGQFMSVEQQDAVLGVPKNDADHVTLEDRQVLRDLVHDETLVSGA
jgi:hypothetical protein